MTFYGQSNPPEDKIAAALFGDTIGFFCEVGAYNGKDLSNTMYFYQRGWVGMNFEPHPDNYAQLCENQPNAINLCCAVGHATAERVTIKTAPGKPIVTGFKLPSWYVESEVPGGAAGLIDLSVPMVTLELALSIHQIEAVDYISIDTDGFELQVLQGIDLARWRPRLIVLEYNTDLSQIDEHLEAWGYSRAHANGLNAFYVRTADDARIIREAAHDR